MLINDNQSIQWREVCENLIQQRKMVTLSLIDKLKDIDTDSKLILMRILKSLEELARRWNIIKEKDYTHRTFNYGSVEVHIK